MDIERYENKKRTAGKHSVKQIENEVEDSALEHKNLNSCIHFLSLFSLKEIWVQGKNNTTLHTFRRRVMSLLWFSYISIADSNIKLPGCKVNCDNRPTGEEEDEKKLEMENKSLICKRLAQTTYYNSRHSLLNSNKIQQYCYKLL